MKKYQKIRNVGHREVESLFGAGNVIVQEKIDGSNFGFGRRHDGTLFAMSRTQDLLWGAPDKQFGPALEHLKTVASFIPAGFLFRCEYLRSPRHNVLAYERAPQNHLVLFEIDYINSLTGELSKTVESVPDWMSFKPPFFTHEVALAYFSGLLEIDAVPQYYCGPLSPESLKNFWDVWQKQKPLLGGASIEGVVIKNFNVFTTDGNPVIAKLVRPEFKEEHTHVIKTEKGIHLEDIGTRFGGPARWRKAVQALRDSGQLQNGPEDIRALMIQVQEDVEAEQVDEIKRILYERLGKKILGAAVRGLPEWYKGELAKL